ncbi:MAG: alpha/beta hydrolase [Anaerolineales bacterium]|nr:alpha/beta hydrolase [Anaerolineales bacterium]
MPSLRSRIVRFFIRRTGFMSMSGVSIPEIRRRTEAGARLLPVPRGVAVRPAAVGGVPGEWLLPDGAPADRALLYIHGGGFLFCSPATHRGIVALLARTAGTRAFLPDYRLAPEHPFPAALDDSLAACRGLMQSGFGPGRIVVAGDSAGGNLTLALMLALKAAGDPLPAAAVCLSPVTDMAWTGESMRTKRGINPIFPGGKDAPLAVSVRTDYVRSEDPRNPLISPLYGDLRGLPPILLHVGGDEILLDDSVRLAERVRAAGGSAELAVWEGMWHVFQAAAPFVPEANQSIRQMAGFIRRVQGEGN